jgi:hypothetical protein
MRYSVIGAGNGGAAMAAELALLVAGLGGLDQAGLQSRLQRGSAQHDHVAG